MSELEELRRRIDRLEARSEISELVTAYAIACDEHDMPRLTSLFTEDAEFDSPSGLLRAKGREEIAAMFVRMFRIRGPAYHWTHDHCIRPDPRDPDRATGLILSHAETSPDNTVSLAAMRYEDEYRRVDGTWLFARRVIHFLYYVPASQFPSALSDPLRLVAGGERRPADYPETLPSWQDFARRHGAGEAS